MHSRQLVAVDAAGGYFDTGAKSKSMDCPTVALHSPHQGAKNCQRQTHRVVTASDAVSVSCDHKSVESTTGPKTAQQAAGPIP